MSETQKAIETVKEVTNEIPSIDYAIANLITEFTSGVKGASEFLKAQVPEVLEQILTWHCVKSIMWFSLSIFLIIIFPVIFKILINKENKKDEKDKNDEYIGCMWGMLICSIIVGTIINLCAGWTWLKIWIAPKLYLIEYGKSLIN